MLYAVATPEENGQPTLDTVTDNPQEYVSAYEPIDVVDGKVVAWAADGTLYHFGTSSKLGRTGVTKSIDLVDVGAWDHEAGEPLLIKQHTDEEGLRALLVAALTQQRQTRRHFWQRRQATEQPSVTTYQQMSVNQLMESAQRRYSGRGY